MYDVLRSFLPSFFFFFFFFLPSSSSSPLPPRLRRHPRRPLRQMSPDVNMDLQSAVGSAGPQQRAPDCSGQRRASTGELWSGLGNAGPDPGSSGADWATPDLTRQTRMSEDMSEALPDDMSIETSDNMSEKNARRYARRYVKRFDSRYVKRYVRKECQKECQKIRQ